MVNGEIMGRVDWDASGKMMGGDYDYDYDYDGEGHEGRGER